MKNNNESGIALITVLLSLAFIFVIAASVASMGAVTSKLALSSARSHRNLYIAESELSRTLWNLTWDIRQNRDRRVGYQSELGDTEEENPDEIRYQADGSPIIITLDDKVVTVVIEDANRGFDFSGSPPNIREITSLINLPEEATEDEKEPLTSFLAKLVDYADSNDLTSDPDFGAELDDYQETDGFDLPRNKAIEYVEEVLWIPGVEDALFSGKVFMDEDQAETFNFRVSDYMKIVPPAGSRKVTGKPSFFSSTDYLIKNKTQLEDDEMEEVKEARRLWFAEQVNIQESIPDLYSRLSRHFSFKESYVYRIRIQVVDGNGLTVNTETVIDLRSRALPRYMENRFSGLRYWRKVNF